MGRQAASLEYLERLVGWAGGDAPFRQRTGILAQNMSAYRSGSKTISWDRLRTATEQVFAPPAFVPVLEGFNVGKQDKPTTDDLPKSPGLYAFFDSALRVIYYGKATSLYAEVHQTLGRKVAEVRPWNGAKDLKFQDVTAYLSAYSIVRGDADFRHDIEVLGLRLLVNNTFNKKGGNFKRTN